MVRFTGRFTSKEKGQITLGANHYQILRYLANRGMVEMMIDMLVLHSCRNGKLRTAIDAPTQNRFTPREVSIHKSITFTFATTSVRITIIGVWYPIAGARSGG